MERIPIFDDSKLDVARTLFHDSPCGNQWYKVNLHVHGQGNDPREVVATARDAGIDILAITDHQTFDFFPAIAEAAQAPGRPLTVLPGMEVTAHEGVHLLAIFPECYSEEQRSKFVWWLDIPGSGSTSIASKKTVSEIMKQVEDEEAGIVIAPHPFSDNGIFDSPRRMSTREQWLDTGHVRLIQVPDDQLQNKLRYIGHSDDNEWINRFVIKSATKEQIEQTSYCLGPLNRSDAHHSNEIPLGCSWLRMERPSVEGLLQVACEPYSRILREEPEPIEHSVILAARVHGGYCDGQEFQFNESLNCIVGDNHAGKSAVLDFIRFALSHDVSNTDGSASEELLARLNDILQPGGRVELFVRSSGDYFVLEREFDLEFDGQRSSCHYITHIYRYDPTDDQLHPFRAEDFAFPIEVYEQNRIGRLRRDVDRQLAMIDEFAGVEPLKQERQETIAQLTKNAEQLKPRYEEHDAINVELRQEKDVRKQLAEDEKRLPDETQQRPWDRSAQVAEQLHEIADEFCSASAQLSTLERGELDEPDDLTVLFCQHVPEMPSGVIREEELLSDWHAQIASALGEVDAACQALLAASTKLEAADKRYLPQWSKVYQKYKTALSKKLTEAGVDSPQELIERVADNRRQLERIGTRLRPRLTELESEIDALEKSRNKLVSQLKALHQRIASRRQEKSEELSQCFAGRIKVAIDTGKNRRAYHERLDELCGEVSTEGRRFKNRDAMIQRLTGVSPLDLAHALMNGGKLPESDYLTDRCEITSKGQENLCYIARDVERMNRLQTTVVDDIPRISVQREGEKEYADLTRGLSPGEQCAAILSLALETRTLPLILDQPEDELGHRYVVNLAAPKMLRAKFNRQLFVVTHYANIPVISDADHVIKMRNRPRPEGGRACSVHVSGCFESAEVTRTLVELEGGERAFLFRQKRYSLVGVAAPRQRPQQEVEEQKRTSTLRAK